MGVMGLPTSWGCWKGLIIKDRDRYLEQHSESTVVTIRVSNRVTSTKNIDRCGHVRKHLPTGVSIWMERICTRKVAQRVVFQFERTCKLFARVLPVSLHTQPSNTHLPYVEYSAVSYLPWKWGVRKQHGRLCCLPRQGTQHPPHCLPLSPWALAVMPGTIPSPQDKNRTSFHMASNSKHHTLFFS